jgi:hypothetical protein
MPSGFDDANRLYSIAERTLGHRVSGLTLRSASSGVEGVLYDAFVFSLSIEEPRRTLAAGILLDGGRFVTAPFGRRFTLDTDDASIIGVLQQMDDWARLRLPDKYLEKFGAPASRTQAAAAHSPSGSSGTLEYFAKVTYRDGVRVPVQVFRVENGVDQVYRDARAGWVTDEARVLHEDRIGVRDHEIWPITRLQAGQAINMIESGQYRRLDIPGLLD